jgi:hypothetical protein
MIPVVNVPRSYWRFIKNFLGFFQLSYFPQAYRRLSALVLLTATLLMCGWVAHLAVVKPWELRDYVTRNKLLSLVASVLVEPNVIQNRISAHLEALDTFAIDIKFKNWEQLEQARSYGESNIESFRSSNVWVSATARIGSNSVPIKMRLKPSQQHLGGGGAWGDKPSYRVKVRQGDSILGMKNFALMDPARRGYLHEWVFREALSNEGIISKRYRFVRLNLNGDDKGVYVIDEHIDKQLIENSRRPESVVIRFFNPVDLYDGGPATGGPADDKYFSLSHAETYRWFETPNLSLQLERALDVLNGFVSGKYALSEVFDIDLFARYFALSDVFGAWHGLGWANMRFYFNPITGLLEPIPDDNFNERVTFVFPDRLTRLNDSYNTGKFLRRFIANKYFIELYLREVNRVSSPQYLSHFWETISKPLHSAINVIRKDLPLFDFRYQANQGGLIGILKNQGVGIEEINSRSSILRSMLLGQDSHYPAKEGSEIDAQLSDRLDQYRSGGYSRCADGIDSVPDFVEFSHTSGRLTIPKGRHVLAGDLVIPSGCSLFISEGTHLLLKNGAFVVSRSPIFFQGTPEQPIHVESISKNGGGILVINASHTSELRHVTFKGLSNGHDPTRFLSGAVTFYRSDVVLESTTFQSNIAGDDYLNIIASQFWMKNTTFSNTVADGFDSDFSIGTIENGMFERIGLSKGSGGDALDFSGSVVEVKDTTIIQVADKGISVGERSKIRATNLTIGYAVNAIVVKDGSTIVVDRTVVNNSERGLVAIQKKRGYGSAILIASEIELNKVLVPYLVERGSELRLDGVRQNSNVQNGKAVIYQ